MNKLIKLDEKSIKINELITMFILSLDVAISSKRQYTNSLQQYFNWLDVKKYDLTSAAGFRSLNINKTC